MVTRLGSVLGQLMVSLLHTAVWSWTVYSGFNCCPSKNYFSCSCKQLKVTRFPNLFSNHLNLIPSLLTKPMIRNKEWKPLESFEESMGFSIITPDTRRFTAWHIWHKWKAFQVLLLVDLHSLFIQTTVSVTTPLPCFVFWCWTPSRSYGQSGFFIDLHRSSAVKSQHLA